MMYPGMLYWWKTRHHGASARAGLCGFGPPYAERVWEQRYETSGRFGDGAFGVRRPLRYLAYKLDLGEKQVAELAKILTDLKTERAQADVDGRRTLAALADAVAGEQFDEMKAAEGGQVRVGSAERLRDAVVKALGRIHAILDAEQRERLAYLIRTGTLTL